MSVIITDYANPVLQKYGLMDSFILSARNKDK